MTSFTSWVRSQMAVMTSRTVLTWYITFFECFNVDGKKLYENGSVAAKLVMRIKKRIVLIQLWPCRNPEDKQCKEMRSVNFPELSLICNDV